MQGLVLLQKEADGVSALACISPDGKPTESGRRLLQALEDYHTPEDIAANTKLPLFRVRSGLRELAGAGYAKEEGGKYGLTDAGIEALKKSG
jgi:hypothetical protein